MVMPLHALLPVGEVDDVAVIRSQELPLQSASFPQRGADAHVAAQAAPPPAVRQHTSFTAQFAVPPQVKRVAPGAQLSWHEVPVRRPRPVRVSQHTNPPVQSEASSQVCLMSSPAQVVVHVAVLVPLSKQQAFPPARSHRVPSHQTWSFVGALVQIETTSKAPVPGAQYCPGAQSASLPQMTRPVQLAEHCAVLAPTARQQTGFVDSQSSAPSQA